MLSHASSLPGWPFLLGSRSRIWGLGARGQGEHMARSWNGGGQYLNVGPLLSLLFKTSSVLRSHLESEEVEFGPGELLQTPISAFYPDYLNGQRPGSCSFYRSPLPPVTPTCSQGWEPVLWLLTSVSSCSEVGVGEGGSISCGTSLGAVLLWNDSSTNGKGATMWWIPNKLTCFLTAVHLRQETPLSPSASTQFPPLEKGQQPSGFCIWESGKDRDEKNRNSLPRRKYPQCSAAVPSTPLRCADSVFLEPGEV